MIMGFLSLFAFKVGSKGNAEKGGEAPQSLANLTHAQRKRIKVTNALKKLERPSGSRWTAEHERILTENLRRLVDATEDFTAVNAGDDDDEDEGNERARDEESAYGECYSTQEQPSDDDDSTQSRKRRRKDSPDSRALKKPKLRTEVTQHVLKEFETFKPQPLQFIFKPHPLEDRSDAWFIAQFRKLFKRIHNFAHDYFGVHDIDQGLFHQPWAAGMSPEFLRYVEDVAEADPMDGGWDKLLQNTVQREWLIVGIVMRVLEVHVFGPNLWGVDQEQKDLLHDLDRAFFTGEGFERQALRSNTVRTILGDRAITKNFHDDVATLTTKVALLLKPLSFFLYSRPPKDGQKNPHLQDQYQALHNIVAVAAYLSICIRLSPTIFYFSNVSTNTPFDPEENYSVDQDGYEQSAGAVNAAYIKEAEEFDKKTKALEGAIEKLLEAGKKDTSRAVRKAVARLDAHWETEPNPPDVTHEAMAKIAVWPNISRYKPGASGDNEAGIPLRQRKGIRIFEVSKSAVVCYMGIGDRIRRTQTWVRLADFVEEKMKKYARKQGRFGKGVVFVAAAAAAGIPYLLFT